VPIVLLVLAPKAAQTITADPEVVIYAQGMLGGIDQVAYTLTLDRPPSTPPTVVPPTAHGPGRSARARRSTCRCPTLAPMPGSYHLGKQMML
jgi:hypothetical protein